MDLTHIESCIERMEEYIGEPGGQQRLIEVLENLGGVRVGRNWSRKTMGFGMKTSISEEIEKDMVVKDLPSNYKRLLRKFAEELVIKRARKKLEELMTGRGTSIIQHLLFVLKVRSTELCDDVVKRCIEIIFGSEEITKSIVTNSVSAYLVETIILVASESRLKKIWSKHLKGKLEPMWQDDIANFVVQRLIDAAQTEELYNEVTDEIHPKLDEIFSVNRPGIGVCLAKACIKFPSAQEKFIDALMSAYYLTEPRKKYQLVPMMLFKDPSQSEKKSPDVWLHGSLMLQYIFRYKNTYDVSKSFLVLDRKESITVATDKSGSHVVESFLQSETVPTALKNEFVHKLLGCYNILQQDRFGNRIVDHLMNNGDKMLKDKILEELCQPAPIGAISGPRRYPNTGSTGTSQHRSIGNHHRNDHHHHHHHHHSGSHMSMGSGGAGMAGGGNSHIQRRPYIQHGYNGGGGSSAGGGGWRQDNLKRHHHQRDSDDYKDRPTKRSYNPHYRPRDDYSAKYRD